MEQMQDICRGSVGPLERTEGSSTSTDLSEEKSIFIYFYASSPDAAACRASLPRKKTTIILGMKKLRLW
jgi:hypothetical protein